MSSLSPSPLSSPLPSSPSIAEVTSPPPTSPVAPASSGSHALSSTRSAADESKERSFARRVEKSESIPPPIFKLSGLLGAWQQEASEAYQARQSGKPRGPISGFPALDRELGGAFAPGVHIVHGQPGTGKTAFALQIALHCGCPALYVTCEMAPLELLRRVTANVTGTYLGRLKTGELTPEESLRLAQRAALSAPQLVLMEATQSYASPLHLYDAALATRGTERHLILVIDSVHSWAESAAHEATEYDALNAALMALRGLSHQLQCPVLAIAERNRDSIAKGGLNAGAGTRKIEYGAETVLDLGRDLEVRENGAGEVKVKAKFVKNRHGAAGREVLLNFHGAKQCFTEAK